MTEAFKVESISLYSSVRVASTAALYSVISLIRIVCLLADKSIFAEFFKVSIVFPELEVLDVSSIASNLVQDA